MLRIFLLFVLVGSSVVADDISPEQQAFVEQKVLPLLEARCFECHKNQSKGGLSLANRASMLKGGESGAAVVPGKPAESLLIEAIHYEGFEMPPRSKMPDAEIAILEKWVADGAPWPEHLNAAAVTAESFPLEQRRREHWVWQPLPEGSLPDVNNKQWPRHALDSFVLAKLESNQLTPAKDADRYALVRRLYFDIIGLPPTPEQTLAFVNDSGTDDEAIAAVVDELLASVHFGERWGRHWLDLVRYGETLGHEFDYPLPEAWHYRDYVIRAFNQDVPYRDFVVEHIAGDLLPEPRRHPTEDYNESVIGTGFWFLGEDKHAPVDVKGEEAARVDNQIDVFSKAFMGLTVACARCHDHKFDAISTSDYYALAGFLQSSRRHRAWLDPGRKIEKRTQELLGIRNDAMAGLKAGVTDVGVREHLKRYSLAALRVLDGAPVDGVNNDAPEAAVFESFEDDQAVRNNWTISGDAFKQPTHTGVFGNQQAVSQFTGKRLVNSYQGTDEPHGKMTSAEFQIEHDLISFQIGGGNFKGQTCLNLVIDGKVVRTAEGRNTEKLRDAHWDVSEFVGRNATLEIVDEKSGPWGHILVDQIVLGANTAAHQQKSRIAAVAAENKLDAELLTRWVERLTGDTAAFPTNPLFALNQLKGLPSSATADDVTNRLQQMRDRVAKHDANREAVASQTDAFADLRNGLPEGWFTTDGLKHGHDSGSAIGLHCPNVVQFGAPGVSSAALSHELRGTLTSPTFELQHPEVLVKVRGKGCTVRLVIDGYEMEKHNALLFRGTRKGIESEKEGHWIRLDGDTRLYAGHRAYLEFEDAGNGWFCVEEVRFGKRNGLPLPDNAAHAINAKLTDAGNVAEAINQWADRAIADNATAGQLAAAGLLPVDGSFNGWNTAANRWLELARGLPAPTGVLAMTEGTPENEFVFIRGSHLNLGETAPRAILTAMRPDTNGRPEYSNSGRLELANELFSENNPVPARVAANRIWHHLMGRGIVPSTDNFGVLGQRPTHPELLDHLATRFRDMDWSVKAMIREVTTSRTYRMSSVGSPQANEVDPTNSLLHSAHVKRLTGEAVRDGLLTLSGSLNRQQFGAPVPIHLTAFMQGRGRPRQNGPLDGNGRRSVYLALRRNFLSPLMLAFDVPAPMTTIGKRTVSNVPAQALIMLNNDFVNQQAERWAKKLLAAEFETANDRLSAAWLQIFGRPADDDEIKMLAGFLQSGERSEADNWKDLCHVLMNSKEFLYLR